MGFLDIIFPKRCVGCGVWGGYICADCVNKMKQIGEPICPMCTKKSIGGRTHTRCSKRWGIDGLLASVRYQGVAQEMVKKFKYRFVEELVDELVELVMSWQALEDLPERKWKVVGVPLHLRREKWRGFNQADILGKKLADNLGFEFLPQVLVRKVYTSSQMGLKRKERMQNVVGAFGKGENIIAVNSASVLVVDDVWTTGTTMKECAKVLKRSQAKEVWGLVVAR